MRNGSSKKKKTDLQDTAGSPVTRGEPASDVLLENESILRSFFDSAGVMRGIVEVIAEDDVLHITDNTVTASFLSLTTDDMRNRRGSDLGEPQDLLRMWVRQYTKSQKTKKPVTFEYLDTRGRLEAWLLVTVSYLGTPPHGNPRFAYVILDITDRKRAETALHEEKKRTLAILEGIADTFYSLDEEWRFVLVNPVAEKAPFGRPAADLLGRVIWDLYPDLVGTPIHRHYLDAAEKLTLEHYEAQSPLNGRWYEVFLKGRKGGVDVCMRDITDRRVAEKSLQESELRYRTVADFTLDWEFWIDPEGKFIYISPSAENILGIPIGRYATIRSLLIDVVYPDDLPLQLAHLEEELGGAGPFETTFRIVRPGGEVRWISHVCRPIHDPDGVFLGTRGSNRDITEHRAAEDALARSNTKLSEVLESIQDDFYVLDRDWKFVFANRRFTSRMGKEPADFLGNCIWDMFPEHHGTVLEKNFYSAMELREIRRFEVSGKYTSSWYSMTVFPSREGITVLGTDITERRQTEEALRLSEEKYRTIVETTNEGIWIVDADRRTTFVNERMARMLGYSPEEMIGRSYRDFVDEESAAVSDRITIERKKGISSSIEYRFQKKDKTSLWTFVNAQPLFDKNGNFAGSLSMISDITLWKMAEEAMRRSEAEHKIATAVEAERHRFYGVLETLPVYVCLLDEDYRMPFANRYFREAFGDPKELRCYDALFGKNNPCEICETYTVMKTRSPHHWFWTGPNGRDYDIYDFPFTDTDGTFMILEMGIDITERKTAEAALKKANAYNRSLIEASLDPLVTINRDGIIGDVNEATIRVTGFSREELVGTDFSTYFTEPKKAKAGYETVFRDGSVTDYALEIRHRDGQVTPVLYNATVYRDADGKITAAFAAARDITERKKAEEALQKAHDLLEKRVKDRTLELVQSNTQLKEEISQRRLAESLVKKTVSELHAAIESTADGIYVVDRAGRIIRYNQNFASMWKIPDELLQSGDDRRVSGYLRTLVKKPVAFEESDGHHPPKDRETYDMLELNDGRIFERYAKPQKMDSAVIGRVLSYRDVTDRRHAEEKLIASLQEKEILIREIHHRVKNNLQIISGLLNMTRLRTEDRATTEILTDMMMKIKTMAQIHTRLYESKHVDKINMGGQIQDQMTDLANIYGKSGPEITCEVEAEDLRLPVDQAIPCALVVNEALSNAFKHAFRGRRSGTVLVSARLENGRVRIRIKDDGIGIPEDVDIDRATSLGLKLIRNLVQQLQGTLAIESTILGTSVNVDFPLGEG
jgi:PAS domain S-box-containing protein